MAFIDEFGDCVGSTVQIEAFLGVDPYGKPTYADPVSCTARIDGRNRLVRSFDGIERVSTVRVILGTAGVTVSPKDRLTLSSDYVPAQPPLLAINSETEPDGGAAYVALYA